MARYFFHIETDARVTDEEGTECATPAEARKQAIMTCGQMMKDAAENFWGSRPWSVTVTNDQGLILWALSVDGMASPAGSSLG